MNKSRRDFITRDLFAHTLKALNEMLGAKTKEASSGQMEDYFDSFEKCYPLLSEAGDLLFEEAIKLGIPTQGKNKLEIAKEIFASHHYDKSRKKEVK